MESDDPIIQGIRRFTELVDKGLNAVKELEAANEKYNNLRNTLRYVLSIANIFEYDQNTMSLRCKVCGARTPNVNIPVNSMYRKHTPDCQFAKAMEVAYGD